MNKLDPTTGLITPCSVCPSWEANHPSNHQRPLPLFEAVVRLLPYPDARSPLAARMSEADVQAMAVDILTHPLCAGIGVYDPVEGAAGREQRGVIAVYLYLSVPPASVADGV